MPEKASPEDAPRLLIVAQNSESQLEVIGREIDITRARRRADSSVADAWYFRAWVIDALYEAVAPPEDRR